MSSLLTHFTNEEARAFLRAAHALAGFVPERQAVKDTRDEAMSPDATDALCYMTPRGWVFRSGYYRK